MRNSIVDESEDKKGSTDRRSKSGGKQRRDKGSTRDGRERSRSPSPPASKDKMQKFQIDQNTNYGSKGSLLNTGEVKTKLPMHAVIKENLLLSDNEVMISFLKFMIGVAILNFPSQCAQHGLFNGFMATALITMFILKSNENLVKAIPLELMN